jgi:glycosyltransferase involved in cell wall biosynthesis
MPPVKQLHLLLAGCGVLRDANIPFRCTIVGEGSCRGTLLALRERLGLTDHVAFVGPLESEGVRHHLRSANVAVLASQSEGHPVSLLEAASVGIPAVAPAVGGVPEIIVHGETGLITDSADPQALGMAMARLCTDHALSSAMGAAARERAVRYFSADRQMRALVEVWEAARRAWAP